ncbi:MAG TPA: phosphoribosylformylglycinamidine synthase subunit PurS [Clostridia bacterium]|nr:phosphoribosylformylglycinamidine synthase subunit PurS [Clostridia bacterium]HHY05759.1 phosphoribosylformylglycinamidine synthase subunit PurS [Clostridia bacterium]
MFKAVVTITYKKSILDPQGNAVHKALKSLGYQEVEDVRMGKHMEILLRGEELQEAEAQVKEMCSRLLANPVIEDYQVELVEVEV